MDNKEKTKALIQEMVASLASGTPCNSNDSPAMLEELGIAKAGEGKIDEAIRLFKQGLEACHDGKDLECRISLLSDLGYAFRLVGDLQESEKELTTALQIMGSTSHGPTARLVLANLKNTYVDAQKYEEAASISLELVRRCVEAQKPDEEACARLDAANSLLDTIRGKPTAIDKCKKVARQAMETLSPGVGLLKDKNLEVGLGLLKTCTQILNMVDCPPTPPEKPSH